MMEPKKNWQWLRSGGFAAGMVLFMVTVFWYLGLSATPEPPVTIPPAPFFDFALNENGFDVMRYAAITDLATTSPVRFCGGFADVYDSNNTRKIVSGEAFDCPTFGSDGSLIKTLSYDEKKHTVTTHTDTGEAYTTQGRASLSAEYAIGDATLREYTTGERFLDAGSTTCSFVMTKSGKTIYKFSSSEYVCGNLASVEYGRDALLIIAKTNSPGNALASTQDLFFLHDGRVHKIGTFSVEGQPSPDSYWVASGKFFALLRDARYEWKYGRSYAASSSAFIPRLISIEPKPDGTLFIVEGAAVSEGASRVYTQILSSMENAFAAATTSPSHDDLATYVPYWIGIVRETLTGGRLADEETKIKSTIKRLGLDFSDSSVKIYADVPISNAVIR